MNDIMSDDRYNFLMWDNDPTKEHNLTQEEKDEGWHWCGDWDDLLIHPLHSEFECCHCEGMDKFRKPADEIIRQSSDESHESTDDSAWFMAHGIESNFEWANDWKKYPTRCVHLTQNAYECVLHTLETALANNQALVKDMINAKHLSMDRYNQEVEMGVKLKLSIQELKRIGDTV